MIAIIASVAHDGVSSRAADNYLQPHLNVQIGHVYPIQSVAISPDGNTVLSGAWDNTAILWDAKTGRELRRLTGHQQPVASVAFTPDGQNAVTMGWADFDADVPVRIWDLKTGLPSGEQRTPQPSYGNFARVLSDGSIVVVAQASGQKGQSFNAIWNTSTGKRLLDVRRGWEGLGNGTCASFALSRDGNVAIVGGFVQTRIIDLKNRQFSSFVFGEVATAVAVSPDGKFGFVAPAKDKEDQTLGVVFKIRAHEGEAPPNSPLLDERIVEGVALEGPKESKILEAAFSQDNAILATAHSDGFVRIWGIPDGKLVRQFRGHDAGILALAISSDGKRLLTGSVDRTARLWDVSSGREVMRFAGKAHYVQTVAFADSRPELVTSDWNGIINSWNLKVNRVQQLKSDLPFIPTATAFGQDPQLTLFADGASVRAFVAGREALRFEIPQSLVSTYPFPRVNSHTSDTFLTTAIHPITSDSTTPRLKPADQLLKIGMKGDVQQVLRGLAGKLHAVSFGKSSNAVLTGGEDGVVQLWDLDKGSELVVCQV